jgi:hypothetical protein
MTHWLALQPRDQVRAVSFVLVEEALLVKHPRPIGERGAELVELTRPRWANLKPGRTLGRRHASFSTPAGWRSPRDHMRGGFASPDRSRWAHRPGPGGQWWPARLEAGRLKEVAEWTDRYRRFWEESYDRLDEYLDELQGRGKEKGDGTKR